MTLEDSIKAILDSYIQAYTYGAKIVEMEFAGKNTRATGRAICNKAIFDATKALQDLIQAETTKVRIDEMEKIMAYRVAAPPVSMNERFSVVPESELKLRIKYWKGQLESGKFYTGGSKGTKKDKSKEKQ